MGYQVAFSPSARRDLRDIVRYISADSPDRAVAFGQLLVHSTRHLSDHPEMGRQVPEIDDLSVREIVVHSYRVVYRVNHPGRLVDIIRFWHGARGTPKL